MADRTILIRNLAQVATPCGVDARRGRAMRDLAVIPRAAMAIRDGRFVWVGPESDVPSELRASCDEFDGRGGTAIPGFVDSHTHLPFAGARESEFNRRIEGESYSSIAASGGGIASTVRATRSASEAELASLVAGRVRTMARHGTTTAEAKSGYGLNLDDELKQLRAIRAASADSPVRLVPTCLAAHEFPPDRPRDDSSREEYVNEIVSKIMPAVAAEKLARFCDVFVEEGVFTRDEGRRILEAGVGLGMLPRIHADELSDTDGAALAAELGCASADHLMYVSDRGIRALAASGTVANLLPGTSFFLMSDRYAPARAMIEQGAIVSLSTDCNPGSSMTESMQVVVQLAVLRMKMTVEEALTAATLNGAFSLGLATETGSLEAGKRADFAILDAPSYFHLVYHYGVNLVASVWRDGVDVLRAQDSKSASQSFS
ncbi:MAG: imidazolonepropionase [Acidobacteria bacterium]|nr:imidazolonepropionase [Acidobacteriota bacterium]